MHALDRGSANTGSVSRLRSFSAPPESAPRLGNAPSLFAADARGTLDVFSQRRPTTRRTRTASVARRLAMRATLAQDALRPASRQSARMSVSLPVEVPPLALVQAPGPRRSTVPDIAPGLANLRLTLPMPDFSSWFDERAAEHDPSLQPLPARVEMMGEARVTRLQDRVLVLFSRPLGPSPERIRFFQTGLSYMCTVFTLHEGRLVRLDRRGRVLPVHQGLYSFAIDQSQRLIVSVNRNPNSTAALSAAQGTTSTGAIGVHFETTLGFGADFFGELEVQERNQVPSIVGFNNRSGHFRTPPELYGQAHRHPLLRGVPFYPCQRPSGGAA